MEWITIDHLAQQVVMYVVGLLLIYLAIEKNYEPAPSSADGLRCDPCESPGQRCIKPVYGGPVRLMESSSGSLNPALRHRRLSAAALLLVSELMIDFGPLLSNPKMFLFGAASQFGIFLRSLWHHFSALISRTLPLSESSERRMVRLRSWYLRC